MKTVLVVLGTRPEAIKLAPVIAHLREHAAFRPWVCLTGQHDRQMVQTALDLYDIQPDSCLAAMKRGQSLSDLTASLFSLLSPVIDVSGPDAVLVQGDTTSCLVGALSAFYRKIPVGHIEAGLRTYDLAAPFPEEANRQLVSRIADLHFAPTARAADALLHEGISPETVTVTGNTVIDALFHVVERNRLDRLEQLEQLWPERKAERRYILATLHRRESFGPPLEGMLHAINDIASGNPGINVVLLEHPNPNVQEAIARVFRAGPENLRVIPPQPYHGFVDLLARSHIVLTDSGGIQEEAPSLDRPVLVLRQQTEREEGVEAGCLETVGTSRKRIVARCNRLLRDSGAYVRMASAPNPYGDGHASERICEALTGFLNPGRS